MNTQTSSSTTRAISKPDWTHAILAIVILLTVFVRVRLLQVPLERDEGEYAYFAQLMLHGIPPYLMAYTVKLPGTSFMYALFMWVFGETITASHLGLLLVNVLTIGMIYYLGRRLLDPLAGVIAGAALAILSVGQGVMGVFAHATNFVILFALAGIILVLRAVESGRSLTIFMSGVSFGCAFLMKQHGIFLAAFALLYFLWERRVFGRWQLVRGSFLFAAGITVPYGICCLVLALYGTFDKFWFWTFEYSREYITNIPFKVGARSFLRRFVEVSHASFPLWMMAGVGLILLFADKRTKRIRLFTAGLLLFSFLSICPGLYFRHHYFVLLLPVISLLNGVAISNARHLLSRKMRASSSRIIPVLLFATVVFYAVYQERSYLFAMDPDMVSRSTYKFNPFPEAPRIARYIRENSLPSDRIAVLGSEPQIFFYANRLSATGHIYMYGLMEKQKFGLAMQNEMISEIENTKPKFIIKVNINSSWLSNPNSPVMVFNWEKNYLKENYQVVGIIDILSEDKTVYLWNDEIAGYTPRTKEFIYVYKRKFY